MLGKDLREQAKLPVLPFSLSREARLAWGKRSKEALREATCARRVLLCSARDASFLAEEKEAGALAPTDLGKITRAPLETEKKKQCVLNIKCQFTKKHRLPVLCGASVLYLSHVHTGAVKGLLKHRALGPTRISDSAVLDGNPESVHFQQVPST